MEKMLIPAKFVQWYINKEHLNSRMAIVLGPLGKVYSIKLQMDQIDMFFAHEWSQFVAFHGITEADSLLLRYDGNMAFTVKVFGPDGCQRECRHEGIGVQQNEQKINIFIIFLSLVGMELKM
uniref:TF-B3 domain-containing protein n=1 Tax=Arundo donax TaxID=35708 RepID=A0A0A9DYC7_ARUDO